jgi:hypothetical protein
MTRYAIGDQLLAMLNWLLGRRSAVVLSVVLLVAALPFAGIAEKPAASAASQRAAKKVSDLFMADLIADRVSDAVDRYDSSYLKAMGRDTVESQFVRHILDLCGRPLDSKIQNDGIPVMGEDILTDGSKRATFTFLYSSRTTRQRKGAKGHSQFEVGIESSGDGKYYVTAFGCCCPKLPNRRKQAGRLAVAKGARHSARASPNSVVAQRLSRNK